ncbi:hypothetical protein [Aquipuribacter hungaricus]|uniref:TFIIS-type domain-containing protein n=1 Tax=Aquipuribacter hungaricus TaxID=545624 RepID=A0ABV7WDE3_9MICO
MSATTRTARTAGPATTPRQRRTRPEETLPLGSLTQREHRAPGGCVSCGSTRLTRLSMNLSDGGTVDFVSCHHCEHRRWEEAGADVPVAEVLQRTARR